MNLKNKRVLITGATGGLGTYLSTEFAKHSCKLILVGRNEDKLNNLKNKLQKSYNVKILCIQLDFNFGTPPEESDFMNYFKSLKVDILVNNAGVFPIKNIMNSSIEDLEECLNVNVKFPFILSKCLAKNMIENKWGRIINIGSSSCYNGSADTGVYCTSKHALLGFSKSLYQELKNTGVRVYTVSPGSIQTPMGKTDTRQDYTTFINPAEIAEYILFIISYDKEMISEEIRLNRINVK